MVTLRERERAAERRFVPAEQRVARRMDHVERLSWDLQGVWTRDTKQRE